MATVVFDLGGVVVLWDPVPAVAAAVGLERAENFVRGGKFDFAAWNHAQDAGRSWAEAEAEADATRRPFAFAFSFTFTEWILDALGTERHSSFPGGRTAAAYSAR